MHIKRFQAQDVNKALEKVKEEFGDDAIILKTNRIKKRDPYTNQTESFIEILAAIDYDNENSDEQYKKSPSATSIQKPQYISQKPDLVYDNKDNQKTIKPTSSFLQAKVPKHENIDVNLKSPLLSLYQIFSEIGIKPNKHHELTIKFLSDKEFSNKIEYNSVLNWLINIWKKELNFGPKVHELTNPLWLAVVGPTGSGKTLTTAKLAAELKFNHKKNGILISMDNYKLGAIEHLKRYASIMDISFYIAKNSLNLREIILENREKDYVLIDTFGKSLADNIYFNELTDIFHTIPGSIKGLALLPALYSSEIMQKYIKFYSNFPISGWIITKIDELESFLPLFNIFNNEKLPVSYITNGQKIPENLLRADIVNLDKIIEKLNIYNINTEEDFLQTNFLKPEKSKLDILREIQA
jgi:flagellar biosynthesis protein FlhF